MKLNVSQAFAVMNALSEALARSIGETGILKEENFEIFIPWLEDTVRNQFMGLCEVLEIDDIVEKD